MTQTAKTRSEKGATHVNVKEGTTESVLDNPSLLITHLSVEASTQWGYSSLPPNPSAVFSASTAAFLLASLSPWSRADWIAVPIRLAAWVWDKPGGGGGEVDLCRKPKTLNSKS